MQATCLAHHIALDLLPKQCVIKGRILSGLLTPYPLRLSILLDAATSIVMSTPQFPCVRMNPHP
jgi:hypothetical protein